MYTCQMIWMHSPQLPKISTTQHERSFSFFSKISSQVRGSELHWVSLRIGAQKTAFAFVMMCPGGGIGLEYAMTANSAWPGSPSTPKEENNRYHVCYVDCVLCTLFTFLPLISGGAGYKWCGYPSTCLLNQSAVGVNFSQPELASNMEGVVLLI